MVDRRGYMDAMHPNSSLDSASDTIEMTHLDDIDITPNSRLETAYKTAPFLDDEQQDTDDDFGGDDEGEQALLGTRRKGSVELKSSLWGRVKRIVIEVGPYVPWWRLMTYEILLLAADCTHPPFYHSRSTIHWRAAQQCLGTSFSIYTFA